MLAIEDAIEINASAEAVFNWFANLRTGEDYRAWHPDHVDWQWLRGQSLWEEGAVVLAKEYLHGRMHPLKFRITRVRPARLIEYKPLLPESMLMSGGSFVFEPLETGGCVFKAVIVFRGGSFLARLFGEQIRELKRHMKEEGENAKRLIESRV